MIATLQLVKDHLQITSSAQDALLTRYILQTEAAIFDYIEVADIEEFYYEHGEGHNMILECAAIIGVTELYENRSMEPLTQAVKDLLRRYRTPVVSAASDDE